MLATNGLHAALHEYSNCITCTHAYIANKQYVGIHLSLLWAFSGTAALKFLATMVTSQAHAVHFEFSFDRSFCALLCGCL